MTDLEPILRQKEDQVLEYPPEEEFWVFLERNVTCHERLLVLELLGRHFLLKLYSFQKQDFLKNVVNMGPVDTYREMPQVMKASKINLNITARSILSGVPQRCLDIMAAGGFLLTNYQSEMDDLFAPGTCVIYESPEDALEKARYYLSHDSERQGIAAEGHEFVKKYFTYEDRVNTMLETAGIRKN